MIAVKLDASFPAKVKKRDLVMTIIISLYALLAYSMSGRFPISPK
jgi:hypothetical protein